MLVTKFEPLEIISRVKRLYRTTNSLLGVRYDHLSLNNTYFVLPNKTSKEVHSEKKKSHDL